MATVVKGGDVVLLQAQKALFVRLHSRSRNFRPVPHSGSTNEFVRLSEEQLLTLTPITNENTPFINEDNAKQQLIQLAVSARRYSFELEVVAIPDVPMQSQIKTLVVTKAANSEPVVLLASNDLKLTDLIARSVETINANSRQKHQQDNILANNPGIVEPSPPSTPSLGMNFGISHC